MQPRRGKRLQRWHPAQIRPQKGIDCNPDTPDVLVLADGLIDDRDRLYELLRGVHSGFPKFAIVLLLDNYDRELVVNSLRAGVRGLFCLASMPFKSLCRCISSVHQGQYWTNTEQMRYVIDALSIGPSVRLIISCGQVVLTPREEQTVNLVTEGLNNREIAPGVESLRRIPSRNPYRGFTIRWVFRTGSNSYCMP